MIRIIYIFIFFRLVRFLNENIDLSDNRVVFTMRLVSALIDLCPQLQQCVDNSQVSFFYVVDYYLAVYFNVSDVRTAKGNRGRQ